LHCLNHLAGKLPDNQSSGDEFLDRIVSATIIT